MFMMRKNLFPIGKHRHLIAVLLMAVIPALTSCAAVVGAGAGVGVATAAAVAVLAGAGVGVGSSPPHPTSTSMVAASTRNGVISRITIEPPVNRDFIIL